MKAQPKEESNIPTKNPRLYGPWVYCLIAAVCLLLSFSVLALEIQETKQISPSVSASPAGINHAHASTYLPQITMGLSSLLTILFLASLLVIRKEKNYIDGLEKLNQDLNLQLLERQAMETTKQNLEKALLQGQKLQAIGTLAGGIAHDFNNILYAIIGYTEMAQEDVERDSLVYKNLGKVLEASQRGQDLISRILTFSRRHHNEFKRLPLKPAISSVLSLLRPTIPASVILQCNLNIDDETFIWGDQTQIHQVLVNIINNAVDAMDGEGLITIHVTKITADNPILKQHPEITPDNYCKIDITDTGLGMDEITLERIFEPFFTTKEVGKGTGLGLATVHAIIEEHRGKILVSSELGHGTRFTIFIPEYLISETRKGE